MKLNKKENCPAPLDKTGEAQRAYWTVSNKKCLTPYHTQKFQVSYTNDVSIEPSPSRRVIKNADTRLKTCLKFLKGG